MSNYTQTTNFATKDALASGNPLKIVKGTEINTEFANIATAVATKADSASPTFTGTVTIPTLAVTTISSNPIFSAGTVNGVAYLNGSKTLTTGTDLVFDGTNLGVGQSSPVANYRVSTQSSLDASSGVYIENTSTGTSASALVRFKNSGTTFAYSGLSGTARAAYGGVLGANVLAMYTDNTAGMGFLVDAAGPITFGTNSTLRASINSSGAWNFGSSGTNTGTSGQALISQGSGSNPTWGSATTLATPVASTSGTTIDFTGIPSWVRSITVMFSGVSTNGTSPLCIQIGTSSGVETSGYASAYNNLGGGVAGSSTAAFGLTVSPSAANLYSGSLTITLLNASTNLWTLAGTLCYPAGPGLDLFAGSKALAAVLDRVRLTTLGGVNTFDAGSINIMYE